MSNKHPPEADNRTAMRRVVRGARKAALATLMAEGGAPYASMVTVAVTADLSVLLLLSEISEHTRNLRADPRLSLLFDATLGHANPQTGPRVSLIGTAAPTGDAGDRARFLALHPGAAQYAGFGDFHIWRMTPSRAHFVGGFARAVWFDPPFGLTPSMLSMPGCPDLDAEDLDAEDLAAKAGDASTGWVIAGQDPDGLDLMNGERHLRVSRPCTPHPAG